MAWPRQSRPNHIQRAVPLKLRQRKLPRDICFGWLESSRSQCCLSPRSPLKQLGGGLVRSWLQSRSLSWFHAFQLRPRPHVIHIQGQCFAEVSCRLFDSPEPELRKPAHEQTLGPISLLRVITEEQTIRQGPRKIIDSAFCIELARREVQKFLQPRDRL